MDAQQIELEIPGLPRQKNHQKLPTKNHQKHQIRSKNWGQKKLRPL